jgi:hypothetical protein
MRGKGYRSAASRRALRGGGGAGRRKLLLRTRLKSDAHYDTISTVRLCRHDTCDDPGALTAESASCVCQIALERDDSTITASTHDSDVRQIASGRLTRRLVRSRDRDEATRNGSCDDAGEFSGFSRTPPPPPPPPPLGGWGGRGPSLCWALWGGGGGGGGGGGVGGVGAAVQRSRAVAVGRRTPRSSSAIASAERRCALEPRAALRAHGTDSYTVQLLR